MHLREATSEDIPLLAKHHRKMFEDIWDKRGLPIDGAVFAAMETEYLQKLRFHIQSGSCKAWIIEVDGAVIASGALSIVSYVPTPQDIGSDIAFIHSMYTDINYRKQRCATRIVEQALAYCRTRGIKRLNLIASDSGRPLYEKIGFQSSSDAMRLLIE